MIREIARKRVLHFSDALLPSTETFVQSRLRAGRFDAVAMTWRHVSDGLSIPCPFVVLNRHEPVGYNGGLRRLLKGPWRVAGRTLAMASVLARSKPDVVHAHFGTVGAAIAPLCHVLGIPLVVSFYGYDLAAGLSDMKLRLRYLRMFRSAAAFTAEGPALARRLTEIGAPARRIRLLPLSLPDWALVPPLPAGQRKQDILRLLQIGRFVEKKGVDISLSAVAEARRSGSDVRLTLVGGGPLESALRDLTHKLGISDAVRFLGYVAHNRLAELLADCDVLIQPSRTSSDGDTEGGHPTILVEALAQGIPILATRHADIPFIVRDGENGLLVDEHDVSGLARSMIRLIHENRLLESLARRARPTVLRRHNPDTLLRLRERIYLQAIRTSPRSGARWAMGKISLMDPFLPAGVHQ